ncbi:MAG: hypothetical protein JWP06_158 [Candidatus Saccharibacteria bacterium]|nr:hypothetical protein [Candidatus Saccharibacteria bacterium]
MRKFLAVALWVVAIYEIYLFWHLLGAAGAAELKTQALQGIVSSGGYPTDNQWREVELGWIDAGLTFGGVLAVPFIFLLTFWLRKKYKRS